MTPTQRDRLNDAVWLRTQIRALAKEAEKDAKELRKVAEKPKRGDYDDPRPDQVLWAICETTTHYARELRRILDGETWEESIRKLFQVGGDDK